MVMEAVVMMVMVVVVVVVRFRGVDNSCNSSCYYPSSGVNMVVDMGEINFRAHTTSAYHIRALSDVHLRA
jgi:hypothetical protein